MHTGMKDTKYSKIPRNGQWKLRVERGFLKLLVNEGINTSNLQE
jgi:hypothetical protein